MEEKLDKEIDVLITKSMKGMELDSPSSNFTENLMDRIHALPKAKPIIYKPLINKKIGFTILLLCLAGIGYFTMGTNMNSSLFSNLTLPNKIPQFTFPSIELSKTTINALLIFGLCLFIQIPLLKYYINNQYRV